MKLSIVFTVAALLALSAPNIASSEHHHAPAPAVDCSSLFLKLADCLTYVTNGSTTTVPEKACCSGLKTVLDTSPECLCEGLKSSGQFGVTLNVTKALTLPAACSLPSPSLTSCSLSLGPSPAAAAASPALSPSAISGGNEQAPAPAPSAGSFVTMTLGNVLAALGAVVLLF